MQISAARVRNGLIVSILAGAGAFLLGLAAVAALMAPGMDLMEAWKVTVIEQLMLIVPAAIAGFVYGYRRNRARVSVDLSRSKSTHSSDDHLLERLFEQAVSDLGLVEPLGDADKEKVYRHVVALRTDTPPLGWSAAQFERGRTLYLEAHGASARAEERAKRAFPFVIALAVGLLVMILAGSGWLAVAAIYLSAAIGVGWLGSEGMVKNSRPWGLALFVVSSLCLGMHLLAPSLAASWPALHAALKGAAWFGLAFAARMLVVSAPGKS